jgi:RecJ-like exonuclease
MGDESGLFERCEEVQRVAFSFNEPLIVHHYDADGLSSGALVAGAFSRKGRPFRRECIKKLDEAAIDRLGKEKEIIFVDLGGGNKRVNELQDVVVIDHHQTKGIEKLQANPMLFGIDGSDELSSSGTAYLVFREHADLGVVGAVGDMQSPLSGMNRRVLEEGMHAGEVNVEEDLAFYGRYCRPLVQFLAYSDDPYVPGISYREDRAEKMLAELGIPLEKVEKRRVYADLDEKEKQILVSALAKVLLGANMVKKTNELIGESYIFPKRPKNETFEANEFSTLLNACGRHSQPDVGIRVCLGDEDAYTEARELLQLHRKMLRQGISYASDHVQDMGRYYFLDGRGVIDESIIGTVCGMMLRQKWLVPIIGIASGEDGMIKVSSRAPRNLVSEGLNLGEMMGKATEQTGGVGGGHKVAAGASIPKDKINEFMLFAGEFAASSISRSAEEDKR